MFRSAKVQLDSSENESLSTLHLFLYTWFFSPVDWSWGSNYEYESPCQSYYPLKYTRQVKVEGKDVGGEKNGFFFFSPFPAWEDEWSRSLQPQQRRGPTAWCQTSPQRTPFPSPKIEKIRPKLSTGWFTKKVPLFPDFQSRGKSAGEGAQKVPVASSSVNHVMMVWWWKSRG